MGILPIKATANTWGEEIYFAIDLVSGLDATATEVVELGDLGYWPSGKAFCLFFGQTPMSSPDEIRPASAVNVIGKLSGNLEPLKEVTDGADVSIEAAT